MLDSITLYVGSYLSEIGDTFGRLVACINSADKAIKDFNFAGVRFLIQCLLFLYGTFMNYACSWFGVFLDFKMPRTANSTNELLYGNLSKVIVLIISIGITIGELYLVRNKIVSVSLLSLVVGIGAFIVDVEICYWLFCKGAFYDTGK